MLNNPFAQAGRFFKGNLHTHSTNSDGSHAPADVAAFYRRAGYDFLALSDHFMERFGWKISDTRPFRNGDFTTLIAAELHAPRTSVGETWHIKALGLPLDFEPAANGETGPELAARAAEAGAFIGIVHPSWYGLTTQDARQIACAHAVEIYNHATAVEVDRGNGWPFCDMLLNEGWKLHGYASDDAHKLTHDCLGGWVHVKARDLDPDQLLEALKQGHFYSSQGPQIVDIAIATGGGGDAEEVAIECSPATAIVITGRGARSERERGTGLTRAVLPLRKFVGSYFRVTVMDAGGLRAWSNPIWLAEEPAG